MRDDDHAQPQNPARDAWDREAAAFDDAPDHGLRDPQIRRAWAERLAAALPAARLPMRHAAVLDIGCGTGSLSLVLAELGHTVTGIDFSPKMIALARAKAKAAGFNAAEVGLDPAAPGNNPDAARPKITFRVMDAANPTLSAQSFDAMVCRHLLWALPDPPQVLQRWADLLKPGGRLVLIEGFWHTGAGLHAQDIRAALPDTLSMVEEEDLSNQPVLWGGPVADERYVMIVERVGREG